MNSAAADCAAILWGAAVFKCVFWASSSEEPGRTLFAGSIGIILAAAVTGCQPSPAPPPVPSPSAGAEVTPAIVYGELLDAGCMMPDQPDARGEGLAGIVAQHTLKDSPWLECLFEGGAITGCAVPCR